MTHRHGAHHMTYREGSSTSNKLSWLFKVDERESQACYTLKNAFKYLMHLNQKLCGKTVFEQVAHKCTAN